MISSIIQVDFFIGALCATEHFLYRRALFHPIERSTLAIHPLEHLNPYGFPILGRSYSLFDAYTASPAFKEPLTQLSGLNVRGQTASILLYPGMNVRFWSPIPNPQTGQHEEFFDQRRLPHFESHCLNDQEKQKIASFLKEKKKAARDKNINFFNGDHFLIEHLFFDSTHACLHMFVWSCEYIHLLALRNNLLPRLRFGQAGALVALSADDGFVVCVRKNQTISFPSGYYQPREGMEKSSGSAPRVWDPLEGLMDHPLRVAAQEYEEEFSGNSSLLNSARLSLGAINLALPFNPGDRLLECYFSIFGSLPVPTSTDEMMQAYASSNAKDKAEHAYVFELRSAEDLHAKPPLLPYAGTAIWAQKREVLGHQYSSLMKSMLFESIVDFFNRSCKAVLSFYEDRSNGSSLLSASS